MKKRILFIIIFIFLFSGCDTTDPKPPEEKPPGYQEDIPWPSLADSPWPRYHGDAQNTGRTNFLGPQSGILTESIDVERISNGIVVGSDSNIYFATSSPGYLYSVKMNGEVDWKIKLTDREIHSTPIIAEDGIVYIGLFQEGKMVAVNNDGEVLWEYNCTGIVQRGYNIGLDGTLYFIDVFAKKLTALDKDGNLLWTINDSDFGSSNTGVTAFSPDGSMLYVTSSAASIIAINILEKGIDWKFGSHGTSVTVDSDGNVYSISKENNSLISPSFIFKLSESGNLVWKNELNNWENYGQQDIAIDKNGNVYCAGDTLYSFEHDGKLRWKNSFKEYEFTRHGILCDGNINIYIATESSMSDNNTIYSYNSDGKLLWEVSFEQTGIFIGSGAIGYNNYLYTAIDYGESKLLIIN